MNLDIGHKYYFNKYYDVVLSNADGGEYTLYEHRKVRSLTILMYSLLIFSQPLQRFLYSYSDTEITVAALFTP